MLGQLSMPRFKKDAFYPGDYSVPDGRGGRRRVSYTRQDSAHLAQRLADMMAAGLHVPLSWEHQDDAKPLADRLAATAKHNLGFAEAARVDEAGFVEVELDVPSDEDARRLPSVRFVSPEIVEDWTDGTGRLWPGKSITHLAVTSRPVQPGQKPFVRLSQRTVRLSIVDRLGDSDMPEDSDRKSDSDSGGKADIKKVLEALATLGVALPDDTTLDNLTDRLIGAAAAKGGPIDTTPPETPVPADEGAVVMSLQNRLLSIERGNLEQRIRGLAGRGVPKPVRDEMLTRLKTVRLSLDRQGNLLAGSLAAEVSALEKMPVQFSHGDPHPAPRPVHMDTPPETPHEVDEVVKGIDKALGR